MTICLFSWPLLSTFTCDLQRLSRLFSLESLDGPYLVVYWYEFEGSIEFEIWTIVKRKRTWRHNDVNTHSIFKILFLIGQLIVARWQPSQVICPLFGKRIIYIRNLVYLCINWIIWYIEYIKYFIIHKIYKYE